MSNLAHLPENAVAKVLALPHGRGLAGRLIALGLTPGSEVCVLQNRGRGPVIVEVHGARVALGRGQAEKVVVEPVSDPDLSLPDCALESDVGE
jgi:ferrous iron transport protein A